MRTKIFSYRGIVGIKSDPKAEGLVNDPDGPNQMGYVLDASHIDVSQEALDILKNIKKGTSSFAEIDVFKDNSGRVILGFFGGPLVMIHPTETEASRDYEPTLLDGVAKLVPNEPPEDFRVVVHDMELEAQGEKEKGEGE